MSKKPTDRRPPEIRAIDDRIEAARKEQADAEAERHALIVRLVNANPPSDLDEEVTLPFEEHQLHTEPFHTCLRSPAGHCVYDDDQDPMHDNCLYCHEPLERK